VHDDFERCYRVVQSKDARFDGWFTIAVLTTGIYCRPSCPARLPKPENVRFFPGPAAAQQAGFRACKRCRPDASPGSPEWSTRTDVVARAMRLIADGTVDRDGVAGLAGRLGYSTRQLERLLQAEVGAGPLAVARAQRAQTARVLVETTDLPITQVAFAAGFASIRQFNDTVRSVFDSTPTALRTKARSSRTQGTPSPGTLTLRLPFRAPLRPDALFGHLAASAVDGLEEVRDGAFRRTLRLPGGASVVALSPTPDHIACRLALADGRDLQLAIARCRRLLDLDADPEAVDEVLGEDPDLAPWIAKAPGRRVPRTVDEHELAVRVVLGQQVSLRAASRLAGRLLEAFGDPVVDPGGGLRHTWPTVEALAGADPGELADALAMPAARRRTVLGLVEALASGDVVLDPGVDWQDGRRMLERLPGVGPWTVELVAMRGLGDPDAFCPTDLGVRRGARAVGIDGALGALTSRSERWRPWRAYAVQHLWAALDHPMNHWPTTTAPSPSEHP
jgi:AraC family transcriptional regulator of adaptative response / DNA-3-methyladenine glycosylase II